MSSKRCVLFFVKLPEKGKVKSRLSKELDEQIVLSLYENFVLDFLDTLKKGEYFLKVCFFPSDREVEMLHWLGETFLYMPQSGTDLGDRMKNAFINAFSEGFHEVLLVGSDIPDLTNEFIEAAFNLDLSAAVIGPASDGGYYLIGFKENTFLPAVFEGIHWGTETVFEETMRIFQKHNYRVHILPEWRDVDGAGDLKALYERNKNTEFAKSRTMAYISNNLKALVDKNRPLLIPPCQGGK